MNVQTTHSKFEQLLIDEVFSRNWEEYDGPEYYNYKEVPLSLFRLITLREENNKWDTYNKVLSAIGNNHAGTFYPAILSALPLIISLIKNTEYEIVKNCGLEIMSDWYCSFNSELGRSNKIDEVQLENFVRDKISDFIQNESISDSERNQKLVKELLDFINNEKSN